MKPRRIIIHIIAIFLVFGTSSCVDFLNEIKINKDKSGQVFIGLEFNALAGLMITESDKVSPKIKDYIIHFPSESEDIIKGMDGITDIESFTQPAKGRIGISFKFNKPKALNNAYYKLLEEPHKWYSPNLITIRKHKIKVRNATPFIKDYYQGSESVFTEENMLNYLHYKTVIHVTSSINSFNVENGSLSQDKRVFISRVSAKEIIELNQNSGFSFKY